MTFDISTLHSAMLHYIQTDGKEDATEVVGYEEVSEQIGYCETCWDEVQKVYIYYHTAEDRTPARVSGDDNGEKPRHTFEYYGMLGELIRALTD